MKKQLLLLAMILLPLVASANPVEINGIYYNLISKIRIAEVTSNPNKYTGSISIPEKVTYNDVDYSVTSIREYAFLSCSGLTSVAIPNSVTRIGAYAFSGCSGLTSITIGNSVTSIGSNAFAECSGLEKVIVSDIAAWCGIVFATNNANPIYYANHLYSDETTEIKNLVIPNGVTTIGTFAFNGCLDLTSITIPNTVTSIGGYAFSACRSLTSITIPNTVTNIGDYAFSSCEKLNSVTIPNSVTSIGRDAFSFCYELTSITIPNTVTSIGVYTFYGCVKLTSATIPNSVTSIDICAFGGCGLTSITIPNSVTNIGNHTFYGCSDLTSVTIGNGINTMGSQAFAKCLNLSDVYCYAENVPNTYSDTFQDSYINFATLHVPSDHLSLYQTTEPWGNFGSIVALTDDDPKPTGIGDALHLNKIEEINNKTYYDLNGRKLKGEPTQKGLYIVNGKKVIVR